MYKFYLFLLLNKYIAVFNDWALSLYDILLIDI